MCLKMLLEGIQFISSLVCDGRLFQIVGAGDEKDNLDVSASL